MLLGILQFRCAPNTGVDKHQPLIGIPSFLPSVEAPPSYYFASLREIGPATGCSSVQGSSIDSSLGASSASATWKLGSGVAGVSGATIGSAISDALGSGAYGRVSTSSSTCTGGQYTLLPNNDAFAEVQLGPLLGKGSFGRVYRGEGSGILVVLGVLC